MGVCDEGQWAEWAADAREQQETMLRLLDRKERAAHLAARAFRQLEEGCAELNQRDDTIVWHNAGQAFQNQLDHQRTQGG